MIDRMQLIFPLFTLQQIILRVQYGSLISFLFILLNGGEINRTHLEVWDGRLRLLYRVQKILSWAVPLLAILIWIGFYGMPMFLKSQLYQEIQIWLVRSDSFYVQYKESVIIVGKMREIDVARIYQTFYVDYSFNLLKIESPYPEEMISIEKLFLSPETAVKLNTIFREIGS